MHVLFFSIRKNGERKKRRVDSSKLFSKYHFHRILNQEETTATNRATTQASFKDAQSGLGHRKSGQDNVPLTFSDLQMHYTVTFHAFGWPPLQIPWSVSAALQFTALRAVIPALKCFTASYMHKSIHAGPRVPEKIICSLCSWAI